MDCKNLGVGGGKWADVKKDELCGCAGWGDKRKFDANAGYL